MEIVYRTSKEKSNFAYESEIFKGKKPLNGFNKLLENLQYEPIDDSDFNCKNVSFGEEIEGTLYLCYPLSVVVKETIKFSTLHELITAIRQTYKTIYMRELQSSSKKPMTIDEETNGKAPLMNRNTTTGTYGIWGHFIGDLCLSSITIYEGNLISVGIDS